MNTTIKYALVALMLMGNGFSQITTAAGPNNPTVFPIKSYPFGRSYGVWGEEFTKWLWHFSLADFPLLQGDGATDCSVAQRGKVWFLYGGLIDETVTRSCTIPSGKSIFISVFSSLSFVPDFGSDEAAIRADAKSEVDSVSSLAVTIDGVSLSDPYSYRASSPEGGFVLSIDDGSTLAEFGLPVGDRDPAVVDGYWLMLPPLSLGQHDIQWASSGMFLGVPYSSVATWQITVTQ